MNNQDSSGQFWVLALDIVFTAGSLLNVVKNLKDTKAWTALGTGSLCTFISFVTDGAIAVQATLEEYNVAQAVKK